MALLIVESVEDIQARVKLVSDMLTCTLNEVLERFTMNEYMRQELAGYLPAWGDRTLHAFMTGVISSGAPDEPDVWNGDMEPFNILTVLDEIYRALA